MTTGRWNKHDPGPLKRWGHTATVVGERMYVVGGFAGSSQGYLNDVNAFDSSHGKWVSSGSVTKKIAAPPPLFVQIMQPVGLVTTLLSSEAAARMLARRHQDVLTTCMCWTHPRSRSGGW